MLSRIAPQGIPGKGEAQAFLAFFLLIPSVGAADRQAFLYYPVCPADCHGGGTMNSSSNAGPAGVWFGYQVAAAAVLAMLCLLAVYTNTLNSRRLYRRRRHTTAQPHENDRTTSSTGKKAVVPPQSGLVTGYDGRRSTSKTITFAWTFVVAWMLITIGFVAARSGASFTDLLHNTPSLYLVLLGGPYAAAILAKVTVSSGVQAGRIQKTPAPSTVPADIVSNDAGSTDLYDFQYTLFNLVALLIVIFLFGAHPGKGFPGIPDFLAILTGGSALAYTVNKGVTSNAPSVSDAQPQKSRVGDSVRVTGANLLPAAAKGAVPAVTVGGVQASGVTLPGSPDTIDFTVPAPTSGAWAPEVAQQVAVTTTAGVIATLNGALTIVGDQPLISHVTPPRFKAGDKTMIFGSFLLAPGMSSGSSASAAATVGGLTGQILDDNGTTIWPVNFTGTHSNTAIEITAGPLSSGQLAPTADTSATLKLSRAGKEATAPVTIAPAPVTTAPS
jgi:hypothetical protein